MHSKALLLVTLALTLLSVQGAASVRRHTNENIPFHLKEDSDGNIVAVIDYGRGPADSERTMEVPCDAESKAEGPVVVKCNSVDNDKTYTLVVPFTFTRDEDGNIVEAVYEEDEEVQVIPFRPKRDENGNVVGVIYEPVSKEKDDLDIKNPWGIVILVAIILTGAGLIGGVLRCACAARTQENSADAKNVVVDDETESGSFVEVATEA